MKRDSLYKVATYNGDTNTYLNKYKDHETNDLEAYICVRGGDSADFFGVGGHAGGDETPMSIDDQRWLDACIAAGKFVPRKVSIPLVKAPDSKYKVGDRVIYDGKETTIVKAGGAGGYYIERVGGWSDSNIGSGSYWYVTEHDNLKPAPTPYIPTTDKPNLTNEVKVYDEHGAPKLKIPEGVYGKFGDPLKSTAKDVSWTKGVGGMYVAAVDPYNPSKSWYEREQKRWYEREQKREEERMKLYTEMIRFLPPYFLHEGSKENRIFIDGTETKKSLDSYIQQPIIIKKSHKQKTLKIV